MNRSLTLLLLTLCSAFTFSPMSESIKIEENQKTAQYFIENPTDQKMAIELTVKEREMNEKGEENLSDTTEMQIFPPQVIIPPGDKRTIRVNWTGKVPPSKEKNFRVIAEQLDLDVEQKKKKKSGVKMLMKYMATLYLTPENVEAELNVLSYQKTHDELLLTIKNTGKKHQILAEPKIIFKSDKKTVELNSKELQGLAGENILSESQRIFVIKTKASIPEKAKVSIKVND